ncbi:MAG: urea ABC transporter ATP-binding subunit UrtE [Deltaproteobacteria bacterium]
MLKIDSLHLFYGASHCLKGVSLEVSPGEITCILGRNGVGKTSLLRSILGLETISSGRVVWNSEDISGMPTSERARKGMALVPQGREIFARLSVEENLMTGFVGLEPRLRSIPAEVFDLFPVLFDMKRRRGGDLSGGQQQQLAIARALVTRPQLLILDEPTEGIQPSVIKQIEDVLRVLKARGDMTILLVEQYFDFAHRLADSYTVMDRGRVVMSGAVSQMVESDVRRHLTV